MTGIRFFAALAVFVEHFQMLPGLDYGDRLPGLGGMGVSVFFVLSGFIIAYNYRDTPRRPVDAPRIGDFFLGRIAKIYPLHLLFLVIALPLAFQSRTTPLDASALPFFITLMDRWLPGQLSYGAPPNKLAWTLGCEMVFYLLTPLIFALLHPWKRPLRPLVVAILAFAALQWALVAANVLTTAELYFTGPFRLLDYLCGVGLCLAFAAPRPTARANALFAAGLVFFAACLAWPAQPETTPQSLLFLPGALLIVGATPHVTGWLARLLAHPATVLLGNASFALYISHEILLRYLRVALNHWGVTIPGWAAPLAFLACLAVIQGLSVLLYRHYERPAQHWLRRRFAFTQKKAGTTTGPG